MNVKTIPNRVLQWRQLLPPSYRYDYFAAAGEADFEPGAAGYSAVNATYLADAALLAYAPPAFALQQYARAGLGEARFFEQAGTRAYLIESGELAIVAFRGTEVDHPKQFLVDLGDDLSFVLRPGGGVPGRVHSGFEKALDDVWDRISPPLARAVAQGKPVWLTGHSLGAALATLAGVRLSASRVGVLAGPPEAPPAGDSGPARTLAPLTEPSQAQFGVPPSGGDCRPPEGGTPNAPVSVYAFASPRVGDSDFAAAAGGVNLVRFVLGRDLVPRVPPRLLGFEHGGLRVLIGEDGAVRTEPEPPRLPDEPGFKDVARRWIEAARLNLFDHAPVLYATQVWNAFVAGR